MESHLTLLDRLTTIPTAAGHEDRVIAFVRDWVRARPTLRLRQDTHGNLRITQERRSARAPIFFQAHLDHPAFVVREVIDSRTLTMEFRGGVHDPYFENAGLEIFDRENRRHLAAITELNARAKPFKRVTVRLSRATDTIRADDIGRWRFTKKTPYVSRGMFHTDACDDLAAVAAALSALDVVRKRKNAEHVGVLLTRAEEVGFIGTLGICREQSIAKKARLICLENSRSFGDSPIGGGPIVRVGDRISVFMPDLTNRIAQLMTAHQKKNKTYKWQRKLMPGGACEATAFSTYGYQSTCLCLPLGNYHNMQDIDGVLAGKRPARVGPEVISLDDYHGLIKMLTIVGTQLDTSKLPSIRDSMESIWREKSFVVGSL